MRLLSKLATLAALVAAAACNGTATAPTDADLVGTWTIVPRGDVLAGDGMGAMTVAIGPDGGYTLEAATFAAPGLGLAAYGRSFGSVTTARGTLRFHPSGGMAVAGGRTAASTRACWATRPSPTAWSATASSSSSRRCRRPSWC